MAHHAERVRIGRTAVQHHRDHFGNHVARTAHDDGVTHPHILATGLQFIVQRGVGDRHTPHKHRGQFGHGRELAGSPHLHIDGLHGGHFFLCRVFVGHGPARFARHVTQLLLQGQVVHLVDHAVNVKGQKVPLGRDALVEGHQSGRALHLRGLLGHGKAPGLELLQELEMRAPRRSPLGRRGDVTQTIGKKAQRAFSRNPRIELAHRAGGGVARVDEGFLALVARRDALALAFVQGLEIVSAHVDLAAHLQHGRRIAGQTQGDLTDGADVARDFFARFAITPGRRLNQDAVFVAQAHGQAVKLQLTHVIDEWRGRAQAQLLAHAGVKSFCPAGPGVGFGADAEHGHPVLDLGKSIEHRAPHTLGGRVRRHQLGVRRFQRLQFAKQTVVLGVWNFGRVQRVVGTGMVVQLLAQGLCTHCPRGIGAAGDGPWPGRV